MNVGILGLGLIGGSIGVDLMRQINVHVFGIDKNPKHEKIALDRSLIHSTISLEECLETIHLLILAIPVNSIAEILPIILDSMPENLVVMDTGSTKMSICKTVMHHPKRGRFVATHPIAGTEYSGPEAAVKGLFYDKKTIVCEPEKSDRDALEMVLNLYHALGMIPLYLTPEDHDRQLAFVSHLSHVTSFALSKTVLEVEKDDHRIFSLAGSGFSSTVRLAKSNPHTWKAIFIDNQSFVLEALDAYILQLENFRELLSAKQSKSIEDYLLKSQEIQRIL